MADIIKNNRIITLDILRGFAVLGILAMNIQSFALPSSVWIDPQIGGQIGGGNRLDNIISWVIAFVFFEGKMRGLFSLMFGASMMLFIERAQAAGIDPVKSQLRRLFWLGVIGLLHMFLIWDGDVLFLYAAVGSAAMMVRNWPTKRLIWAAIGLFALGITLNGAMRIEKTMLEMAVYDGTATSAQKKSFAELSKQDEELKKEEAKTYTLSYPAMVNYRITEQWSLPAIYVIFTFLETMPFMMLGMALYKNGFITGSWDARHYRKIAWQYLGTGTALTVVLAAIVIANDFRPSLTLSIHLVLFGLPQCLMTVGFAALILRWAKHSARSILGVRMAAAGRMALTNYIMTSVIMTSIFNYYGLALWGQFNLTQLWLFVISAWLIMLWWSKPWLERFQYGPLEWAWRSLAKRQIQPMLSGGVRR
jgi:uncharacterized protein